MADRVRIIVSLFYGFLTDFRRNSDHLIDKYDNRFFCFQKKWRDEFDGWLFSHSSLSDSPRGKPCDQLETTLKRIPEDERTRVRQRSRLGFSVGYTYWYTRVHGARIWSNEMYEHPWGLKQVSKRPYTRVFRVQKFV